MTARAPASSPMISVVGDKIDQRGEHILLANSRIPDNPHGFQHNLENAIVHPLAGTPYVPQYSRHDP